jgi:hypothetical protein
MSEERMADLEERFEIEWDHLDHIERREESQVDDALLEIAQAKMMNWALERVYS